MSINQLFSKISRLVPGFVLAACAAILWGTAGTAQTFIQTPELTPLWVGALRLIFACLVFFPLASLSSKQSKNNSETFAALPYGIKVCLAGICMALFNLLFFSGVKIIGVALGSCVIIASAPIWAGLMDSIIKRKLPDTLWLIGVSVAIAGGIWMAVTQAENIKLDAFGLTICLTAGFCYASYSLLAKELVKVAIPSKACAHAFGVACPIAICAAWFFDEFPSLTANDLLIVFYLGVIVTGLAYLLYSTALKTTQASTCVALGLLEPVTAFILAVFIVKENINPWTVLGLIGILGGLALVLISEQKRITLCSDGRADQQQLPIVSNGEKHA